MVLVAIGMLAAGCAWGCNRVVATRSTGRLSSRYAALESHIKRIGEYLEMCRRSLPKLVTEAAVPAGQNV